MRWCYRNDLVTHPRARTYAAFSNHLEKPSRQNAEPLPRTLFIPATPPSRHSHLPTAAGVTPDFCQPFRKIDRG